MIKINYLRIARRLLNLTTLLSALGFLSVDPGFLTLFALLLGLFRAWGCFKRWLFQL